MLIAAIVPLLLRAASSQPPAVAEFAPQPQKPIQQSLKEQSSSFGSAPGGAGAVLTSPSPEPAPAGVPNGAVVLHCVGDPPRQIEDPQSPPCVPFWLGDNGGATSKGVGRSEIDIAYQTPDEGANQSVPETALANFFNQRFELYGRKIVLKPYSSVGADAPSMHADAATVDSLRAFANVYYQYASGGSVTFYDDLARRGIVGVMNRQTFVDEAHTDREAPYEWSYQPDTDVTGRSMSAFVCRTLRGQNAKWGGPAVQTRPRVFGIVTYSIGGVGSPDLGPLQSGLADCGIHPMVVILNGDSSSYAAAAAELQTAGVTSLIVMQQGVVFQPFSYAATEEHYYPEWLVSWGEIDSDNVLQGRDPEQNAHTFGIRFWNKRLPLGSLPCEWAAVEGSPGWTEATWPRRSQGVEPGYDNCHWTYPAFLLLASGLQMAGPHLTAQTFSTGLQRAIFPNPGADGPPYWQPPVAFSGQNHFENSADAAIIWWSQTTASYETNTTGTFCYYEHGARFRLDTFPEARIPLFQGACR